MTTNESVKNLEKLFCVMSQASHENSSKSINLGDLKRSKRKTIFDFDANY